MAVRYTCRLAVLPATEDRVRVAYRHLMKDAHTPLVGPRDLLVFRGPEVVIPPDTEMTRQELGAWLREREKAGTRRVLDTGTNIITAPLVQSELTYEDLIPKGSVTWEVAPGQDHEGKRNFRVFLRSHWDRPIPNVSLATCWSNGDAECVFVRLSGDSLLPSFHYCAEYPSDWFKSFRERASKTPAASYWIALLTDGYEFDRIPGSALAAVLGSPDA